MTNKSLTLFAKIKFLRKLPNLQYLDYPCSCTYLYNSYILMDYPLPVDTISMKLSICVLRGHKSKFLSVPEDCFYLIGKSADPDEMPPYLCSISSGSSLFAKVPV